jgi:hypothetical protein
MTNVSTSYLAAFFGITGLFVSTAGSLQAQDDPLVAVPSAIGDSGRDLVLTPVPRCRVIDTRLEGGRLTAGVPRNLDVAGTLAGQGGAADCLIPFGPATVVVIKRVPVQPGGPGNLTAWAFGGAMPSGSVVDFRARLRGGGNAATDLLLPICNPALASCTYDLTIQANGSDTDVVADVAGYFSGVTG